MSSTDQLGRQMADRQVSFGVLRSAVSSRATLLAHACRSLGFFGRQLGSRVLPIWLQCCIVTDLQGWSGFSESSCGSRFFECVTLLLPLTMRCSEPLAGVTTSLHFMKTCP